MRVVTVSAVGAAVSASARIARFEAPPLVVPPRPTRFNTVVVANASRIIVVAVVSAVGPKFFADSLVAPKRVGLAGATAGIFTQRAVRVVWVMMVW